jgi:hypothetical protein
MAPPVITARTTPTGYKLPEGFRTTIAFALKPAIQFWEREVGGFGFDGGDPIDTTTQFNIKWHTFAPKQLLKSPEITCEVGYDPDCMLDIPAMINRQDSVTIHYPDGSTAAFYGYLQKFMPRPLREGEFPMATVTVFVTNYDYVSNVEQAFLYTPAAGT